MHEAFSGDRGEISEPDCESDSYIMSISIYNVIESEAKYESGDSIPSGKKVGDLVEENDTIEYSCTKSQQIAKFPKGVKTAKLEAWGAEGGNAGNCISSTGDCSSAKDPPLGGKGGHSLGTLSTLASDLEKNNIKDRTLYVYVGGKGPNVANGEGVIMAVVRQPLEVACTKVAVVVLPILELLAANGTIQKV